MPAASLSTLAADRTETRLIGAVWLILLIGTATIAAAWFFELVLGYQPCKLCLEQRIPYYVGLSLAALALIVAATGTRIGLLKAALGVLALVFLVNAGLGVYHAGVEWAFWPGPADCGGRLGAGPASAGDLLGAVKATRVVSCTEAAWRLFGVSMAGWNAIISLLLASIAIGALARRAEA
ncbi:MAG: disulfide bond formation protein B [Beijerinckiaceae bacterium]|nr:disulfide bond formation protein B [Beijerinckiaceae bacterium]